jgi:translocation and assembly module TamB
MSDDEVLSRLLFGVPPNRLSALQLTRLGLAATSIAGVGGDGVGMLARARAGLGLSRLRIDGDKRGGTALEAGRRLSERLYLGGRQVLEGGDPRAVLGIQVAPQIRFESDVGSRGSGAGAAFELEY